ncbi:MAG TPA: TOBE domain-containing protein, partial [Burkholderiales bacterium]|nr:TOBE domain-containing protein [Burkholderiales bacterium]
VRLGGLEIELEHRGAVPGPVRIAIRPESIVLKASTNSGLRGVVRKAAYLGTHMEYTVEAPIGPLFVVDRDVARPIAAGTEVAIGFSDHGVALVPS